MPTCIQFSFDVFPFAGQVCSCFLGGLSALAEKGGNRQQFDAEGREALQAALREEQGWLKVHAAEALVTEGEGAAVRNPLAAEPAAGEDTLPASGGGDCRRA